MFLKGIQEPELISVALLPQTALLSKVLCFRTKLVIILKCKVNILVLCLIYMEQTAFYTNRQLIRLGVLLYVGF